MKSDLHCHSYYSDGTESPAFLVQRGIENGLTHLALTDHDCTAGLAELDDNPTDLVIIKGVEISCHWLSTEVHVVGLFVDPENIDLAKLLERQQQARRERVAVMDQRLAALGTEGLLAHLQASPCVAYTRSHVAKFLVAAGVCKTHQKAFKTHLSKGGKIYVPTVWCELAEAIEAINRSGGIAVLAHPGRYTLNRTKLANLVRDFKALGGAAIEGSYPNIDPRMMQQLENLAIANDLFLSAGSDFHSASAHWTDVGKLPPLDLTARERGVWLHPGWRG